MDGAWPRHPGNGRRSRHRRIGRCQLARRVCVGGGDRGRDHGGRRHVPGDARDLRSLLGTGAAHLRFRGRGDWRRRFALGNAGRRHRAWRRAKSWRTDRPARLSGDRPSHISCRIGGAPLPVGSRFARRAAPRTAGVEPEAVAVSEKPLFVTRWTGTSTASAAIAVVVIAALSLLPLFSGANVTERLTTLFVYIILAVMWNALAGYAGLVSVGQQMFFGLGAYATIRLSYEGMNVYAAMLAGSLLAGLASLPLSSFMLRLRGGEFAIATWVVATIAHLLVNFDPLIEGETGKSLIALNAYEPSLRQGITYWATLGVMVSFLAIMFALM